MRLILVILEVCFLIICRILCGCETWSPGSKKLEPLVTGEYTKPGPFRNTSSLQCKFVNNGVIWVTVKIFINLLKRICCMNEVCLKESHSVCG
jgi:hypothetical protein